MNEIDQPFDKLVVGANTCTGHRTRGAVEQPGSASHGSKDLHLGMGHQR